jgi:hypothetical protein
VNSLFASSAVYGWFDQEVMVLPAKRLRIPADVPLGFEGGQDRRKAPKLPGAIDQRENQYLDGFRR